MTDAEAGPETDGQVERFSGGVLCHVSEASFLVCLLGANEESKPT